MFINHKLTCSHAQTPAARRACRKAAKVALKTSNNLQLAGVGNGTRIHFIDLATGTTRCGKEQPVYMRDGNITEVDCKGCKAKYGHAHS